MISLGLLQYYATRSTPPVPTRSPRGRFLRSNTICSVFSICDGFSSLSMQQIARILTPPIILNNSRVESENTRFLVKISKEKVFLPALKKNETRVRDSRVIPRRGIQPTNRDHTYLPVLTRNDPPNFARKVSQKINRSCSGMQARTAAAREESVSSSFSSLPHSEGRMTTKKEKVVTCKGDEADELVRHFPQMEVLRKLRLAAQCVALTSLLSDSLVKYRFSTTSRRKTDLTELVSPPHSVSDQI